MNETEIRNHNLTAETKINLAAVNSAHLTGQARRLHVFLATRANQWIALPEILGLGIAQYNARIHELRQQGYTILNKTERKEGQRHSWFMYVPNRNALQLSFA
jgi:hypothetical protein